VAKRKDTPPKSAGARTVDTPLTAREEQFRVAYWQCNEDGPAAARAIGYATASAHVRAYEIMSRPNVKRALDEDRERVRQQAEEKAGITLADVVKKLAELAMFDTRLLITESGAVRPPSEWPDDVSAAIAGIEVFEEKDGDGMKIGETTKVKLIPRTTALDMLMKHLGGYETDNKQRSAVGLDAVTELVNTIQGFQGEHSRLPIKPEQHGRPG
jgi:phage terminase small subunit